MRTDLRRLAFGAAIAALTLALPQHAATAQATGGRTVTHDKIMQRAGTQFDRLDTNKDALVDAAEYEKYIDEEVAKLRARLARRFAGDDANADGKLTREEYISGLEKWFQGIDANKDGQLEQDEFTAARKAARGKPGSEPPKP